MSHPSTPAPVVFFLAVTCKDPEDVKNKVFPRLSKFLGFPIFTSKIFNFSEFTTYYEKEMGKDLKKFFVFFEKLKSPEFLIELKHLCYKFERALWIAPDRRGANLDPGYLCLSKLVLATFKDFSHRIYLGKGVFAEVTLIFKQGDFSKLPWTYPDYLQPWVLNFFKEVREWYRLKLRDFKCW